MTQLFIVDDQVAYREALAAALERCDGVSTVQQASDLADAKTVIARADQTIDLALFGRELSEGSGVELRSHLLGFHPACQVVVFGIGSGRREWARAVAIGAVGIYPKCASLADITGGINRLIAGERIISRSERIALLEEAAQSTTEEQAIRTALARLTRREREILESLARGMSDKETAIQLGVSTKTVATHMASLLDKLGVDSRLRAVLTALRYRVVSLD
jgi:RNA polymerase sigma factor (sigma-70 family)